MYFQGSFTPAVWMNKWQRAKCCMGEKRIGIKQESHQMMELMSKCISVFTIRRASKSKWVLKWVTWPEREQKTHLSCRHIAVPSCLNEARSHTRQNKTDEKLEMLHILRLKEAVGRRPANKPPATLSNYLRDAVPSSAPFLFCVWNPGGAGHV